MILKKFKHIFLLILIATMTQVQMVSGLELIDPELIVAFNSEASIEEMIEDIPEEASLDDPFLMLINRDNRIEEDVWMDFAWTPSGHQYNALISDPFNQMITAGEAEGHYYQTVSAYRTMAFQASNFDSRYYMYINEGYSDADAFYMTDLFVAPADATEHATGLAFDLLGYDWNEYGRDLHQAYGQYSSAIWLAENAYQFGFILRYPRDKTHITGYEYEPWHFRYVGREHAEFMYKHGITLEEYLTLIDLRNQAKEEE